MNRKFLTGALVIFGLAAALFSQNCSGTKFSILSELPSNFSIPAKRFSFLSNNLKLNIQEDLLAPEIQYQGAFVDSRGALIKASYKDCPNLAVKIDLWLGSEAGHVFQNTCFSAVYTTAAAPNFAYCNFRSMIPPGTDAQKILIRTWKPKSSCDGYFDSSNNHKYSDRVLSGTVSAPDFTYAPFNEGTLITVDKSNFSIKLDRNTGAVYEFYNKRSTAPSNAIYANVGAAVQLAFHAPARKLTEDFCGWQGYWNPTQAGAFCSSGSSSALSPTPTTSGYNIYCDGALNLLCTSANENIKIGAFRLMNWDYGPSSKGPYNETDSVFLAQTIKANDNFIEFDFTSENRGESQVVTFEAPAVYFTNRYRNWSYKVDGESAITTGFAPVNTTNMAPYFSGYIQKRIPWVTFENTSDASNDAITVAWFIDPKIEENALPSFAVQVQDVTSTIKFDNFRIFNFEKNNTYRSKYVIFPFQHNEIIKSRFGQMSVSQTIARLTEEFNKNLTAPVPAPVPNQVIYAMKSAAAGDELANWPVTQIIDRNPATSYSSNVFPSTENNRGLEVAAWLDGNSHPVSKVILKARMLDGSPLGFPASYKISVTKPDNSGWMEVGTFNMQPDFAGNVQINLGKSFATYGVLIRPITLGFDNYGNYFFQMAEIELGN